MKKKDALLLVLIFAGTALFRIFLAYQTPFFSLDESYATIRQIEHILSHGTPLFQDPLSFGGRTLVFSPVFAYITAFFSLIVPIEATGKIILNLLASTTVFLAFFISYRLTKDSYVSLLTAFIAGFIPVYFSYTFNRITPVSLILPLFLTLIYSFITLEKKSSLYLFIITLIFYAFLSPTVIVFILGLLFYIILLKVGKMQVKKAEYEIIFFSVFFILWSQLILYKKLLLSHGPLIIWQNFPAKILANYFVGVSLLDAVYLIGELPFIFGLLIIFRYVFKDKNKEVHFLIAFALSTGLLLWLRVLPLHAGLMFFGIILVLLFAVYYNVYLQYLTHTKFSRFIPLLKGSFIIVFILTSVYPSWSLSTTSPEISPALMESLDWLRYNSDDDLAVFSSIAEGELITAIAHRKNYMDRNFLGIRDADKRFEEYEKILTSPSKTQVVSILEKNKVRYLLISPLLKEEMQAEAPPAVDEECFEKIFEKQGVDIYKVTCRIQNI